jgi:hypothetical protein
VAAKNRLNIVAMTMTKTPEGSPRMKNATSGGMLPEHACCGATTILMTLLLLSLLLLSLLSLLLLLPRRPLSRTSPS